MYTPLLFRVWLHSHNRIFISRWSTVFHYYASLALVVELAKTTLRRPRATLRWETCVHSRLCTGISQNTREFLSVVYRGERLLQERT